MNDKITTMVRTGDLLTIEQGEYSDYHVSGVFRVKADFVPDEAMAKYLKHRPSQRKEYNADFPEFIAWLTTTERLIEAVEYRGWHIGSYGSFSSDFN